MRRAFAAGLGAALGVAAAAAGLAAVVASAELLDAVINGDVRAAQMRYWTALSFADKPTIDERRRELDEARRRRWWRR